VTSASTRPHLDARRAWGQVFRSDSLHNLTTDDLVAFDGLNVRVINDLRRDDEREREPGHEPIDLIVTVGRSVDPAAFGPLPANVHVEQYVPHSLLFVSVDAVVCHGGFNTVMGALTLGRPLVLAPLSADQPVHARRCAALGVGRVVDGQALDPAEIRAATRAVLEDPSYREAAQRIQREIAALPDIRAAADIAERAPTRAC
jgi:MGT family glycosyltransferase